MPSNIDKVNAELKKAMGDIKKAAQHLKSKPGDQKAVALIRDTMKKYPDRVIDQMYADAAAKDAKFVKEQMNSMVPGVGFKV